MEERYFKMWETGTCFGRIQKYDINGKEIVALNEDGTTEAPKLGYWLLGSSKKKHLTYVGSSASSRDSVYGYGTSTNLIVLKESE
jgi:hypothetical protein